MIELTFHLQHTLFRYRSQRKAPNDKEWLQYLEIFEVSPHYCTKGISCLKIELCLSVRVGHHPTWVQTPHVQEHCPWEAENHHECQCLGADVDGDTWPLEELWACSIFIFTSADHQDFCMLIIY